VAESDESKRLSGIYAGYGDDLRKNQAWGLDNPGNAEIRAALVQSVFAAVGDQLGGDAEVLDMGCGSGWWLDLFHRSGVNPAQLHGVDAIDERVAAGRERLPDFDLRVGDVRRLPYADGQFTVVLIVSVLSDLQTEDDVEMALREAVRVLTAGGILLCYEPRIPNPFNRDVHRISKRTLDRTLGRGWVGTPLTVLPPLSYRLGSLAPRMYPWLAKVRPLLSHRLVEYRK
jgi:ubiquinone/menaquinone biosynthesis C-methylase UbiE